ncbi:MAG: hypothetical protein R3350_09235, partial [Saprospiraceae bacterium]|nr:hypothetical protein [Saprospiraceae bacterium]
MNPLIKKIAPHLGALLIFLALCVLYFLPQLEGKVVQQGDIVQYRGMTQEILEFQEKSGRKPLWTNSMFGGMPSYQINAPSQGNYLKFIDGWMRLGIEHPAGRFLAAMIGFYILGIVLGLNRWLCILGAIGFGFTTNNFILYEAGHVTKLRAISFFPLVAAGMILTYRKHYLWGSLLFAIGLGLNIMSNHVQMTYYFFLTLPFFAIARFVYDRKEGQLTHFLKASLLLVGGGILAVGTSMANLWVTYEYSRETMRGEPILEVEAQAADETSSSETEGLAWNYAMQWSNGTLDLFASLIPGVVGGSSQEEVGRNSAVVEDLRRKGYQAPPGFAAPLYWGKLPFTSGPAYFGATLLFLFLVGLLLVHGPLKWWLGLGTLFVFLLSLGQHFELLNRAMFDYFPLYNKFRTPNSVLSIASFLVPFLGVLGLQRAMNLKNTDKSWKALKIAGGISAATCLFFVLIGPSLFDFSAPGDARYAQAGLDTQALIADRQDMMRSDATRSLVLIALTFILIRAYMTNRIKKLYALLGIGLIVTLDMWTVGMRYLDHGDFVEKANYEANFRPRPVDEQIMQDTDP